MSVASVAPTFAVIADIHGNVPALEAVLADVEAVNPDAVIIAGDFINRGPQSRAVLERLVPLGHPALSGNHDTWLSGIARGDRRPEGWETPWWTPARRAMEEIAGDWADWLAALPASVRVELPGAEPALVVHGSPRHNREGMGRMRSDEDVAAALAGVEERTVIGAHIHYPYERRVGDTHVVVIGAVGCPFNGDPRAQYGLFTWDAEVREWRVEQRAVAYDRALVYAAWRTSGYLDDGSVASRLMLLEHMTATTHFVPFWEWAEARALPLDEASYTIFRGEFRRPPLPE